MRLGMRLFDVSRAAPYFFLLSSGRARNLNFTPCLSGRLVGFFFFSLLAAAVLALTHCLIRYLMLCVSFVPSRLDLRLGVYTCT